MQTPQRTGVGLLSPTVRGTGGPVPRLVADVYGRCRQGRVDEAVDAQSSDGRSEGGTVSPHEAGCLQGQSTGLDSRPPRSTGNPTVRRAGADNSPHLSPGTGKPSNPDTITLSVGKTEFIPSGISSSGPSAGRDGGPPARSYSAARGPVVGFGSTSARGHPELAACPSPFPFLQRPRGPTVPAPDPPAAAAGWQPGSTPARLLGGT